MMTGIQYPIVSKLSRPLCLPYSVTGVNVVSSLPSNFLCSWCSILCDKSSSPAMSTASIGDDEIVILLAISAVFALTETHSLFMYNPQGFWTIILIPRFALFRHAGNPLVCTECSIRESHCLWIPIGIVVPTNSRLRRFYQVPLGT